MTGAGEDWETEEMINEEDQRDRERELDATQEDEVIESTISDTEDVLEEYGEDVASSPAQRGRGQSASGLDNAEGDN